MLQERGGIVANLAIEIRACLRRMGLSDGAFALAERAEAHREGEGARPILGFNRGEEIRRGVGFSGHLV